VEDGQGDGGAIKLLTCGFCPFSARTSTQVRAARVAGQAGLPLFEFAWRNFSNFSNERQVLFRV
jgi:hypothetical protein